MIWYWLLRSGHSGLAEAGLYCYIGVAVPRFAVSVGFSFGTYSSWHEARSRLLDPLTSNKTRVIPTLVPYLQDEMRALTEYNDLAFVDLEKRLSAVSLEKGGTSFIVPRLMISTRWRSIATCTHTYAWHRRSALDRS